MPSAAEARLEIAHVLFIDIVGYSKRLVNEQTALVRRLNEMVRASEQARQADAHGKLIRIPTGDGMALAFFTSPDAPVRCAIELSKADHAERKLELRMGIHSGPVDQISDVNERANVTGAGINMAQRVMDCGDGGHILLSKRVADDLRQYERWQPHLYDLGACEVKHGVSIEVVNFFDGEAGNAELPEKFRRTQQAHAALESRAAVSRRRRIVLSSAALLLLALALVGLTLRLRSPSAAVETHASPQAAASNKSIAILPFKPLVPESSDQVLEMGMADTLIMKLSGSGDMIVPSLTTVRTLAGTDPIAAGRKLGVHSVLEGTVQRVGDRLRVTVRLIKVADGTSLWSSTFIENFTDVFTVQDTISQKVAEALALRLNADDQRRLTKRYTENVAAYQLYLTGRFHWNKLTPPETVKSIGFFEQAVQLDPGYALAYFGLAEAYRTLGITGAFPPKESFPKAKEAAMKALQLDPSLAEPHATLAMIYLWFDWDWAAAEREAKSAISLDATSGVAHLAYAQFFSTLGRHAEALPEAARGRELDPASLISNTREGAMLYLARRYDAARERLEKSLELDPKFGIAHMYLGKTYLEQGKNLEALAALRRVSEFSGENPEAISILGYALARTGDRTQARAALERLKSLSAQRYVSPYHIAVIHAGLGEQEEALDWLERGFEQRDPRLTWLKIEPPWDVFRANPRFVDLLRRIGLE